MTLLGGLGCTLVGLGPSLVLFISTVAPNPIKIIVFTASGFFWLLALLLTSTLWLIPYLITPTPLPCLLLGAVFQELTRWAFYVLMVLSDKGLCRVLRNPGLEATRQPPNVNTENTSSSLQQSSTGPLNESEIVSVLNRPIVAYVAGLGFGLVGCVFQLLHVLNTSFGPGVDSNAWNGKTFFVIAAFQAMCVSLMHVFWSLILYHAFERRAYIAIVLVYLVHLSVPCLSLLNDLPQPWPEMVCVSYVLITVSMAIISYYYLTRKCPSARSPH